MYWSTTFRSRRAFLPSIWISAHRRLHQSRQFSGNFRSSRSRRWVIYNALPRQPITSSPYAVQTIRAASAAVADDATQLGGFDASQYVRTNDTRFSDDRYPLPNSPNNIQNNPATQQSANFNVNGNGTVGGTLSGNVVNAATQFNIGGNSLSLKSPPGWSFGNRENS